MSSSAKKRKGAIEQMKLNEFTAVPGSNAKAYRKGRGVGSGNGKTAGRGHKGQKARSGGGVRPGFEGGQMPLFRRLPKRGFNNKRFATKYVLVKVDRLNLFEDGAVIDLEAIKKAGIISFNHQMDGLKILNGGELNKKLTVKADKFTAGAKEAIEKAGGQAEEV